MPLWDFLRSRLERELLDEQAELAEIIKIQELSERHHRLLALANKIGASTVGHVKGYGQPTWPELIQSIEASLQAKAAIVNVQVSSTLVIVSGVSAVVAVIAALASWAAVVFK